MTRYLLIFTLLFASCSPEYRHSLLLKKYPHLIQVRTKDSTVVRTSRSLDTAFIFTRKTDTLHTEHFSIYYKDSILRIKGGCPPCTTHIHQPEKIILTQTPSKTQAPEAKRDWPLFFLGFVSASFLLYIFTRAFRRNSNPS